MPALEHSFSTGKSCCCRWGGGGEWALYRTFGVLHAAYLGTYLLTVFRVIDALTTTWYSRPDRDTVFVCVMDRMRQRDACTSYPGCMRAASLALQG